MFMTATGALVAAVLAASDEPTRAAPPVRVLYSFERDALEREMGKSVVERLVEQPDGSLLYRHALRFVRKHATRGEWALAYRVSKGRYNLLPRYARGEFPAITARPPLDSYHDPADWFYQRACQIIDDALARRYRAKPRDWSPYAALRFDVFSDTAPAVLVWDGRTWRKSLAECTGLLTRCGDKVVVFWKDGDHKVNYRVLSGGRWSAPQTAFVEKQERIWTIALPRVSPPNFVPLAWSLGTNKHALRVLRVVVE